LEGQVNGFIISANRFMRLGAKKDETAKVAVLQNKLNYGGGDGLYR
jgi:hypothetical protein